MKEKILLSIYFLGLFLFLLFVNLYFLEGIPHVPDDTAYLFMSRMFASGHIILPIPYSPEHFNFFPGILSVEQGYWLFQYPFGHPILLSFGSLFGFPNIIPPLVATLSVLLMIKIYSLIYKTKNILFLLPLPLISPFFISNSASFMSHTTAAFYLLLATYSFILYVFKKRVIYCLITGLSMGLLFNTRPLTSMLFILFFGIYFLHSSFRKKSYKSIFLYFYGLFIFFLAWTSYNSITSGHIITSQYYNVNHGFLDITKPLSEEINSRITNTAILFKNLTPSLFNWPITITYIFIFLPFLFKKQRKLDLLFLCFILFIPVSYFFYNGTFIMYGPRFWYETTPFIFLLTARGFQILYNQHKRLTIMLFLGLCVFSILKLSNIIKTYSPDIMTPLNLQSLKTFNFVDARIPNLVKKNHLQNAIIFVDPCGYNWWCYGSVFSQNSPNLNTDIIYAKNLGMQKNTKLISKFPKKHVYIIDYYTLVLQKIR